VIQRTALGLRGEDVGQWCSDRRSRRRRHIERSDRSQQRPFEFVEVVGQQSAGHTRIVGPAMVVNLRGGPLGAIVRRRNDGSVASFEAVADEYDAARPTYPDEVFDALGPLAGLRVLDVGAGTGIATRGLIARQATVIAIDPGHEVIRRAMRHTAALMAVVGDGALLPRSNAVDLVSFAQSWHWLDPATRVTEVGRVLRPGGRWAGWWSHARADGQRWFSDYWDAIERACPGTSRAQRDTDWGATIAAAGMFDVDERVTVAWTRHIGIDAWMTDQATHSYLIALPREQHDRLLARLRAIVLVEFPNGAMSVPYETWLWIARRRPPDEGSTASAGARTVAM
jgi:SAM-dependent methyltransferase